MPIYHLTFEKKQELEKEAEKMRQAIAELRAKSVQHIWQDELQELLKEWKVHEEVVMTEVAEDAASNMKHGKKKSKK